MATLSDLSASSVTIKGRLEIDRLRYDIGRKSDPQSEWLSGTISADLNLSAYKNPE